MTQEAIAANIKHIIRERGMKQKTVGERAGFTEQQFSRMLNGRNLIHADHIPAIANALGVNYDEVFAERREGK